MFGFNLSQNALYSRNCESRYDEIGRFEKDEDITKIKAKQTGDVSATFADISVAHATFGFQPETTIEDGVREYVD